jgi:hypothetical protein
MIKRGIRVNLPPVFIPARPSDAVDNLPVQDWRVASSKEIASVSKARLSHAEWVVFPDGALRPAVRTVAQSPQTWQFRDPCLYCGVLHTHGPAEGYRSSHCRVGAHPWSQWGYYLLHPEAGVLR